MHGEVSFTDSDFALLQKGLDNLKPKEDIERTAAKIKSLFSDTAAPGLLKMHAEIDELARKERLKNEQLNEEVVLLQAKLINFKKFCRIPCEPTEAPGSSAEQ